MTVTKATVGKILTSREPVNQDTEIKTVTYDNYFLIVLIMEFNNLIYKL